jgi:putative tryptophan/tyrosine transport system permease protein
MIDALVGFIGIGLGMGLVFLPAVLGLMLALRCLDFPDLGIEASVALGAAAAGAAMAAGQSFAGTLAEVLVTGLAAGTATSLLHVRAGVPKLLAGVIVLTASYSVALRIMGGPNISLLGRSTVLDWAATWPLGTIGMMPGGQILLLAGIVGAVVLIVVVFLHSLAGLRLRLVGTNPVLASDLGISRTAYIVGGVAAANAIAALSGMLLAMQQGFSDASSGLGTLVVAIASLAIGEHLARWLQRWSRVAVLVGAALLGSIAYQFLIAVALRAGMPASDLKLATALLVTAVVAFGRFDLGSRTTMGRGY